MTDRELKPCPFCGSTTHIERNYGDAASIEHWCSSPSIYLLASGPTMREARDNWNTRAAAAIGENMK